MASPAARARIERVAARLRGASLLELPSWIRRPPVQSFRGRRPVLEVPEVTARAIAELAVRAGSTVFDVAFAAFAVVLARWSGQEDIVVGTGVAARRRPELERVIGMFVNSVVLRADLSGDPTVRALLARTRDVVVEALGDDDLPFDKVVEAVDPPRDASRSPLFQVMFSFHDAPLAAELPAGLSLEVGLPLENGSAKLDLNVVGVANGSRRVGSSPADAMSGGMTFLFEHAEAVFDPDTIDRLMRGFGRVLAALPAHLDRPISTIPVLTPEEEAELRRFGARTLDYPRDRTLDALFAARANEGPDRPAVIEGDRTLTYAELDRRSAALAAHLCARGVARETAVAILLDRSIDFVVAMLAIVRAGGTYMPLDRTHPPARLEAMIADAGAALVVGKLSLAPPSLGVAFLDLEAAVDAALEPTEPPSTTALALRAPEDVALLVFTSGSTGAPKGVEITHRAIARLVLGGGFAELGPGDVTAFCSNVAFDAATFELWGALLTGAAISVVPHDVLLSPTALADHFARAGVTASFLTAPLFRAVAAVRPDAFRGVKTQLAGGDIVDPAAARAVLEAGAPLHLLNGYGPTECTTFALTHEITRADCDGPIPIGRPIGNTEAYVLDRHRHLVPIGVVGELFLGGDGLARGYRRRPELTTERFVPSPFAAGERLYATGDLARVRPDGVFEILGRRDRQVKVRGFRIELPEIELALERLETIAGAAVIVQEDSGEKRLVAYVVPRTTDNFDERAVRAALATTLPEYMVPSVFVKLAEFPLTDSGKIDRRRLPALAPSAATSATPRSRAPESPLEVLLAEIWTEVLGAPVIGADDDFFELGGHSLLAMKIAARVHAALGVELSLADLFTHRTIATLAPVLLDLLTAEAPL